MEQTEQEALEITPEAAAKWAAIKREYALEANRAQYKLTYAERDLEAVESRYEALVANEADALPKEDKSLSNAEQRQERVRELLRADEGAKQCRKEIDAATERLAFTRVEHTHAADMLRIMLEFAYFGEPVTASSFKAEDLVKLTEAGREAVGE